MQAAIKIPITIPANHRVELTLPDDMPVGPAEVIASGVVFDALHLVTAEEVGAAATLTFNEADFVRLIDATSPPIRVPPDPPAVTL
jgi:hypothetical protein